MTQAAKLAQLGSPGISTGFKNRIINGAMMIDQRNAGASVSVSNPGTYLVDRFKAENNTDGTLSAQQSTTVPNNFKNSLLFTVGTADASLGSTQYAITEQRIEGLNIADLGWGTSAAKTVTLSFQVRSSVTGTFGGSFVNSDFNRTYPFTYTISAANTWETKSITVAGDTSGTWLTTNGIGLIIRWGFGVGSSYSTTAGAWASGGYLSATGATNLMATAGATFYITGVQLEVGTTATDFEYRDYGRELMMCQRYYEKSFNMASAPGNGAGTTEGTDFSAYYSGGGRTRRFDFKVTKRTAPTITVYGGAPSGGTGVFGYYDFSTWRAFTTTTPESISDSAFRCECTRASSFTNGLTYLLDGNWTASAEL